MKDKDYYIMKKDIPKLEDCYTHKHFPKFEEELFTIKPSNKITNRSFLKAKPFDKNGNGIYLIIDCKSEDSYCIIELMLENNINYNKLYLSIENNIKINEIINYIQSNYFFDIEVIKNKSVERMMFLERENFEDFRDNFEKIIELIKNDKYVNELYELNHGT